MNEQHDPHRPATGMLRIWRAWFFSMDGLRSAWTAEAAFRQELALAMVLIPCALLLPATMTQKALLIACVMLLLIVELLNSAVESAIDRISLARHELAKRAKDIASAAVLLALLNLALVWAFILWEIFD
jgi:diacylglycerol kinase (ATP)